MIELNHDSIEARIVKLLLKCYPVTFSNIQQELKLRELELDNALKKLSISGIVGVDVLPGEKFIRLLRRDIRFCGIRSDQKEKIKKKFAKREKLADYDGPMYV